MPPPGTWTQEDAVGATPCSDRSNNTWAPLPASTKVLIVAGTMKSGTTWLFRALAPHKGFVHATSHLQGGWDDNKEVHYFDMPALGPQHDYSAMWPQAYIRDPAGERLARGDFCLLDASPDYFVAPFAPLRIKKVVPHARLVFLLRDPIARIYSQWRMIHREACGKGARGNPAKCKAMHTEGIFKSFMSISKECRFGVPGSNKTYLGCFACSRATGMTVSNYAAVLGSWLSFIPPEQVLLVRSEDLEDDRKRVRVLNDIVRHAGLEGVPAFTEAELTRVKGYQGRAEPADPATRARFQRLRSEMATPLRDLVVMQQAFWPGRPALVPFEAI